ncbi:HAD family hydrolase [Miltoncostaea oceani]|uniref:HAD family hydrolase n=1 Tax=Miltoncostaea oceani TaxID=2843216 RepID=UPI001C3E5261|nr:HAD family hydrolase [Miltoncostaea oceani]
MLILFDIDGTLLMGTPRAHTEALAVAIGDVYGVPVTSATSSRWAPRAAPTRRSRGSCCAGPGCRTTG